MASRMHLALGRESHDTLDALQDFLVLIEGNAEIRMETLV